MSKLPAAVFLDRDGTIMEDAHYIKSPDQVRLIPGAAAAVKRINDAKVRAIVVTNQSGLARGIFTLDDYEAVRKHFESLLQAEGAHIDASYFCPDHPSMTGPCDCRKPGRGLVDRAAAEFGIDPAQSFVVGDRWLDVELARVISGRGVLVRTGYGQAEETRPRPNLAADAIVDNLIGAAGWILRHVR